MEIYSVNSNGDEIVNGWVNDANTQAISKLNQNGIVKFAQMFVKDGFSTVNQFDSFHQKYKQCRFFMVKKKQQSRVM